MNALANIAALSTASLDYSVFKKAMTNACKVVEKRSTIPVLGMVMLKAMDKGVLVSGTDLDLYTSTFVPGDVSPDFVCLIDANKLFATMNKVKDAARINFTMEGEALIASIGKLNLNLKQECKEADFPDQAADGSVRHKLKVSNNQFVLPSALLGTILSKVAFAISTEATRYYLNGVYMHIPSRSDTLTFVATDGHRLARYEMAAPAGAGAMPDAGVIIPHKTITELLRLVKRKGCPEDTMVTVTDTGVSFLIGEDELLESKVIDGTFPDYQRVIPAGNEHKAAAMTADMMDAIKQASSVLSQGKGGLKLTLLDDRMVLSCSDPDFGTASTEIVASNDQELEIGFNAGYLLDLLTHMDGDVRLSLGTAGDPAIFQDSRNDAVTYVLMPTRV